MERVTGRRGGGESLIRGGVSERERERERERRKERDRERPREKE